MKNELNKYTETFITWNKVAKMYENKFMDMTIYNTTYNVFCKLIETENPNILEIGCGPGNITKYLLSKRPDFEILGLDVAPKMIELAKKNNPKAKFEVMDIRLIKKIERKFDAIVCGFILPYLSKTDRLELVNNCKNMLTKNGVLYLSFVEGRYGESKYLKGSNGLRMFFYYHELSKIYTELIENDFKILNKEDIEYETQNGIQIHTVLIAQAKLNN